MERTASAYKLQFQKKIAWVDSAITLHWLKKEPSQLQPFVANRVDRIQRQSKSELITWRHVRGELNPADLISRGLMPEELLQPEAEWPDSIVIVGPEEEPAYKNEFKKTCLSLATKKETEKLFHVIVRFSSTSKIINTVAIMFRFARNCKNRQRNGKFEPKMLVTFTVQELTQAENAIIRLHQRTHFREEYAALEAGKEVHNTSSIKSLCPIMGSNGIMRVGGRTNNAKHISDAQKNQILMPKCRYSELIVRETHQQNLHAGAQATHGYVKMKLWPLRVKDLIKKELQNCVRCRRAHPRLLQQFMGQLPEARVTLSPPFHRTGVDYAVPFELKSGTVRNAKSTNVYLCVFVCLATKAVHLEIVSDLTTKGFLAAFDRFTARRGLSAQIFFGQRNELRRSKQ